MGQPRWRKAHNVGKGVQSCTASRDGLSVRTSTLLWLDCARREGRGLPGGGGALPSDAGSAFPPLPPGHGDCSPVESCGVRIVGTVAMEAVLNELVSVDDLMVRPGPMGGREKSQRVGPEGSWARPNPLPTFGFAEGSLTTAPGSLCGARPSPEVCALPQGLMGVAVF